MSIRVKIDHRECKLKELINIDRITCPVDYENLEHGDIIVYYADIPIYVFERKTIPDLTASIYDAGANSYSETPRACVFTMVVCHPSARSAMWSYQFELVDASMSCGCNWLMAVNITATYFFDSCIYCNSPRVRAIFVMKCLMMDLVSESNESCVIP